jgi:prepilin-type N-terminal cleavage/methylation domain-containing protein
MKVRRQQGFTLVEVVIVLALGALLLTGVMAGRGGLKNNASISSGINQFKNFLAGIQNEATHSVIDDTSTRVSGAGNSDYVVFGKLVQVSTTDPGQADVWTLVENDSHPDLGLEKCDHRVEKFKDGLSYQGSGSSTATKQALIFTRQPERVFVAPDGFNIDHYAGQNTGSPDYPKCSAGAAVSVYVPPPGAVGCGGVCIPPTPPGPPASCNGGGADPAYTCGLLGKYFRGDKLDSGGTRTPTGIYVDSNIGGNLSFKSPINSVGFIPTLSTRTAQNVPQYASVQWTGEIKLNGGGAAKVICVKSDDGNSISISAPATSAGSSNNISNWNTPGDSTSCVSVSPTSTDWYPIKVEYKNNWSGGLGSAYIDMFQQGGGNINDNELRVANTAAATAFNAPALKIGLNAYYYNGSSFNSFVYESPSPEKIGSGFTYPDFLSTLKTKTGKLFATVGAESVEWDGFIHIPTSGSYTFCTEADDGAALNIDYTVDGSGALAALGTWVAYDWPATGHGLEEHCGSPINLSAGQHRIVLFYHNMNSLPPPFDGAGVRIKLNGTELDNNLLSPDDYFIVDNSSTKNTAPSRMASTYMGQSKQVPNQILKALSANPLNYALSGISKLWHSADPRPKDAHAAANLNVLDPINYQDSSADWRNQTILKFNNGDTSTNATITIDPTQNTFSKVFGN